MIKVWVLGNFFSNWIEWKTHYQYSMLNNEFEKLGCEMKFIHTPNLIIRDNSKYVEYDNELFEVPDIALIKTFLAGSFWKEKMQKLQSLGTFIINNPDSMIEYTDKVKMYEKLESAGLPIPKTVGVDCKTKIENIIEYAKEKIGWPCVIKPNYGWSAAGVTPCYNASDLRLAIENMNASLDDVMGKGRPKPTSFVIQELVNAKYMLVFTSAGREKFYTTMVYGGNSHLQKTTYKQHPSLNVFEKYALTVEYQPSNEVKKIFEKALDVLNLDFVRCEIFVTDDGYKICELNGSCSFGIPSIACRENIAKDIAMHVIKKYQSSTTKVYR